MKRFHDGAGKDELLTLVRELHAELSGSPMASAPVQTSGSGKVSVIMPFIPGSGQVSGTVATKPVEPEQEEKVVQVLQVDERELEAELEEMRRSAELKNELSAKVRQAKVEWDDPMDEIPTLASHRDYLPKAPADPIQKTTPPPVAPPDTSVGSSASGSQAGKDLNEVIGKQGYSLNEKLRSVQSELSERLKDAPLQDLRKAIGINDRYLYINELFNGNEAMFDRSLKTLNDFHAYSEAEFWMQRELRTKLGWKDDHALVQQFLQLVRRRFS